MTWNDPDPEAIHGRRWAILGVMCLSLVLIVLANSSLNVALPTLIQELKLSATQQQWVLDAYALVFGGLLLSMGALGDRFGRRGALQVGLGVFGLASLAAVFATAPGHLIAARAAMGIGGALVMPATLSIIAHVFPPTERGKAMGIWAAFAGLGGALGPIIGGGILEVADWQAIFLMNLPVVVLALVAGVLLVPTSRDPAHTRLDPVGAGLSILALASVLYAIIEGPVSGWTSWQVLAGFATTLLAWPAFVLWELRSDHPMLPMRFFRDRGFTMGNVAVGMGFFVMFAFFFVMMQYLQFVRGYTALEAGLRTLPLAAGMIVSAPQSDRVANRIGTPNTTTLGLIIVALGMLVLSGLAIDTPYWILGLTFFALGNGMGMTMAPSTTIIMDSVPGHKAGVGSAMNDTSREVGGALGIAMLGSVLNAVYQGRVGDRLPQGIPGPARAAAEDSIGSALRVAASQSTETAAAIGAAARESFLDAAGWAFGAGAVVALVAAMLVRSFMPRRALQEQARTDRATAKSTRSSMAPPRGSRAELHSTIDDLYDAHMQRTGQTAWSRR